MKKNLLIYKTLYLDHYQGSVTKVTLVWTRAELEKKKKIITTLSARYQKYNTETDLRDERFMRVTNTEIE
jgi:hypothetical protein